MTDAVIMVQEQNPADDAATTVKMQKNEKGLSLNHQNNIKNSRFTQDYIYKTSQILEYIKNNYSPEDFGGKFTVLRLFHVYHPVYKLETNMNIQKVSDQYHVIEKFMDKFVVAGIAQTENQLYTLMGLDKNAYEMSKVFFDDLVANNHFAVDRSGKLRPLENAEKSVKTEKNITSSTEKAKMFFDKHSGLLIEKEVRSCKNYIISWQPHAETKVRDRPSVSYWLPSAPVEQGTLSIFNREVEKHNSTYNSGKFKKSEYGLPDADKVNISIATDSEIEEYGFPYFVALLQLADGTHRHLVFHSVVKSDHPAFVLEAFNKYYSSYEFNSYRQLRNYISGLAGNDTKTYINNPVAKMFPIKDDIVPQYSETTEDLPDDAGQQVAAKESETSEITDEAIVETAEEAAVEATDEKAVEASVEITDEVSTEAAGETDNTTKKHKVKTEYAICEGFVQTALGNYVWKVTDSQFQHIIGISTQPDVPPEQFPSFKRDICSNMMYRPNVALYDDEPGRLLHVVLSDRQKAVLQEILGKRDFSYGDAIDTPQGRLEVYKSHYPDGYDPQYELYHLADDMAEYYGFADCIGNEKAKELYISEMINEDTSQETSFFDELPFE